MRCSSTIVLPRKSSTDCPASTLTREHPRPCCVTCLIKPLPTNPLLCACETHAPDLQDRPLLLPRRHQSAPATTPTPTPTPTLLLPSSQMIRCQCPTGHICRQRSARSSKRRTRALPSPPHPCPRTPCLLSRICHTHGRFVVYKRTNAE